MRESEQRSYGWTEVLPDNKLLRSSGAHDSIGCATRMPSRFYNYGMRGLDPRFDMEGVDFCLDQFGASCFVPSRALRKRNAAFAAAARQSYEQQYAACSDLRTGHARVARKPRDSSTTLSRSLVQMRVLVLPNAGA